MYPQPSLRRVASVLLLSGMLASVHAQIPFMKVDGKESNLVYLQQLNIDVRIHGTVAITTWTMTFKNSTGRTLEGELNFPLAEGVSVARYALDINGRLREAVPVEKEKGTMVFESIERRRVDPGLLEKVEGNGFRTRIYPIAPHGIRTVLIGYEEELSAGSSSSLRWRLPLAFTRPLEVFNLNIQVLRGTVRPVIEDNIDREFQFQEWENNWSASRRWEHFKADRSLVIVVPKQTDEQDVMMQQEGNHYLYLLSAFPSSKKIDKPLPRRITLLWDASLSGLTRDHAKELQLLDAYFSRLKEVEVTLVPFNYTVQTARTYAIHNGGWQLLREALEHTVYDGATQFGVLHPEAYPGDEYLLFSDGRSNYGSDRIQAPPKPLYAIVATANTDFPYLRDLTERSGGDLINLETGTVEEAKTQLLYQRLYFMGIKSDPRLEENYPSQPVPVVHGISVAGICYDPVHTVVLQFGYGGKVVSETKVSLDHVRQKTGDMDLSKIWAQKKIAELDKRYEDNKSVIQLLGRRYGLVTRNTSLIVLETVEDYVTYNIEPPAELREEYDRIIKSGGQTDRLWQETTKDRATDVFNQLLTWWNTKVNPMKPVFKPSGRTDTVHGVVVEQRAALDNGYAGPALQGRVAGLQVRGASTAMSSISVRASDIHMEDEVDKKTAGKDRSAGSSGEFRAFHHEAQTAYLSRLKKAPAGDQYAVYLQERKSRLPPVHTGPAATQS